MEITKLPESRVAGQWLQLLSRHRPSRTTEVASSPWEQGRKVWCIVVNHKRRTGDAATDSKCTLRTDVLPLTQPLPPPLSLVAFSFESGWAWTTCRRSCLRRVLSCPPSSRPGHLLASLPELVCCPPRSRGELDLSLSLSSRSRLDTSRQGRCENERNI